MKILAFISLFLNTSEKIRPIVHSRKKTKIRKKKRSEKEREELVKQRISRINEIQEEVQQDSPQENYIETFEENAEKDAVLLAEVDVEQLNKESAAVEQVMNERKHGEKAKFEGQLKELTSLKGESEDQLCHKSEVLKNQITRADTSSEIQAQVRHEIITSKFRKTGKILKRYLNESQQQISNIYKDLTIDYKDSRYNLAGNIAQTTENSNAWRNTPQILEVHINILRCVKDKLPKGRYVMLCSVLDRIGGKVIELKKSKSRKWRRVTSPKAHSGEHYLSNLIFDESVMLLTPPRAKIKPSMVLLFELFLLKSRDYSQDQVLGWGVFPLIDAEFELNKGKLKVPLLFGPVDTSISKYEQIENAYRENLDAWLANMYFTLGRKDTLPNPYTVQLALDERTKHLHEAYEKVMEEEEELDVENNKGKEKTTQETTKAADTTATAVIGDENRAESKLSHYAKKKTIIKEMLESEPSSSEDEDIKTNTRPKSRLKREIKKPEYLHSFTFHIPKTLETTGKFGHKAYYLWDEALTDMGFRNILTAELWISLLVLIVTMWIRAYLHSFGSWLFLFCTSAAISEFTPMIYGFKLDYAITSISQEIGVIFCGNLFNTLAFAALILLTYLLQKLIQGVPALVYKFVGSYGIATTLDFLALLLVDLIIWNMKGEALKLYNYYATADNNGAIGIFITVLIYGGLFLINFFILYNYLVLLHMEGRLIDIYTRVTADGAHFFLPYDNEVSEKYLRWIIVKIKRENARLNGVQYGQKYASVTYNTVESYRNGFLERTTYIATYRKKEDGTLALYRHFVRMEDGAICELEESLPFSVDEYPLLERWPSLPRARLPNVVTDSEIVRNEESVVKQNSPKRLLEDDFMENSVSERSIGSHDVEPQVILIKND